MGTRGLVGVKVDGQKKMAYNHFDSYPSGVGIDFCSEVKDLLSKFDLEELKDQARDIRLVSQHDGAIAEDVEDLQEFACTDVGGPTKSGEMTYYQLLREMQGHIGAMLEHGIMTDDAEFLQDSLFCEWAYLLDLDEEKIVVYRGFNKISDDGDEYGPCTVAAEYDLDDEDLFADCDESMKKLENAVREKEDREPVDFG